MTEEEIVQKFIHAGRAPSKYTVQPVLGFSAQTLVRRGFKMSNLANMYRELTAVEKHCPCCGHVITNKVSTYCSQSCAAKVNNKRRVKKTRSVAMRINHRWTKVQTVVTSRTCLCCEKPLSNNNSKYCSLVCQQKYQYDLFITSWLAGADMQLTKGSGVSNRIRRYLFDKYECKCSRCEWGEINPSTGKTPLEVEHIDGDSGNDSPDNLTLLCPNCHSLTSTYKALNKGNGRHSRLQRYKDGKSY